MHDLYAILLSSSCLDLWIWKCLKAVVFNRKCLFHFFLLNKPNTDPFLVCIVASQPATVQNIHFGSHLPLCLAKVEGRTTGSSRTSKQQMHLYVMQE